MKLWKIFKSTAAKNRVSGQSLWHSHSGTITTEFAFALPFLALMGLAGLDAAGIHKNATRGETAIFSIGNTVSSLEGNVSCTFLNRVADLAFDSYISGNWGAQEGASDPQTGGNDDNGSGGLQIEIRALKVLTPADPDYNPDNVQARLMWGYYVAPVTFPPSPDPNDPREPGNLVDIPEPYQAEGEFFIEVSGATYSDPLTGYLGIFHGNWSESTFYFFPRNQDEITISGSGWNPKCRGIANA